MSLFASKCAKGKQVLAQQVLHLGFKSFSRSQSPRTRQQAEVPAGIPAFGVFARTTVAGVREHRVALPTEQEACGLLQCWRRRRGFHRSIFLLLPRRQSASLRPFPAQKHKCRPLQTLPRGTGRAQDPVRGHFELVLQQNPEQEASPEGLIFRERPVYRGIDVPCLMVHSYYKYFPRRMAYYFYNVNY